MCFIWKTYRGEQSGKWRVMRREGTMRQEELNEGRVEEDGQGGITDFKNFLKKSYRNLLL